MSVMERIKSSSQYYCTLSAAYLTMTPFNPPSIPEFVNWQYDQLNTFSERNRKFDFYSRHYYYACVDVLNSHDYED